MEVSVTALLITYNQERYVAAALRSVLEQTWPLEIIICDDASTDGTVEVIREVLAAYAGPHRVTLHVQPRNRGVVGNQNDGLALAQGELVVFFEGDDIARADRVEKIVAVYLRSGRRVAAIGSSLMLIDETGRAVRQVDWPHEFADGEDMLHDRWQVHGCTLAVRRDIFTTVGPIAAGLLSGDIALWLRAAFASPGGVAQVRGEPLVRYRVHGSNVSRAYSPDYASAAALRESCRRLLANERAQVEEIDRIGRHYGANRALRALRRRAQRRADLVGTVAHGPRWQWPLAAARAFGEARLRSTAGRIALVALSPGLFRLIKKARELSPSRLE